MLAVDEEHEESTPCVPETNIIRDTEDTISPINTPLSSLFTAASWIPATTTAPSLVLVSRQDHPLFPAKMPRFRKRSSRYASRKKRPTKRKTYGRRRTKRPYRPIMTRKRILNTTSRKKRNTMLSVSNTQTNGATQPITAAQTFVAGNRIGKFLWCATAQDLSDGGGNLGTTAQAAVRTATNCYMRGISENIRIQTSSGLPWFHRRICFTLKGPAMFIPNTSDTPIQSVIPYIDTSNGMQRLWLDQSINNMPNTIANRESLIFKGTQGIDWSEIIAAPTDPQRITVKFDHTWTIRSGNANGTVAERKLWHGMNKTLVYDDDEAGSNEVTSYISTTGRSGMGDYFIYDIIAPGSGSTAGDVILFSSSTSLYWHER